MKRLVYYAEGRQYYWLETHTNSQQLWVLTKRDVEELQHRLTPVDTNSNVVEIVVFILFAVTTFTIILTAS